jgi:3'-phosphoadenosine 5'-phosphosulfate sulfotransferase (PAPS reductase)/FAD synthetase
VGLHQGARRPVQQAPRPQLPFDRLLALHAPIAAGEDIRAGRWWWELPEQKECGLHVNHPARGGSQPGANDDKAAAS